MRGFSIALAVSLFCISAHGADTLDIVLTGDILLDRGVRQVIDRQGIDQLFSAAVAHLRGFQMARDAGFEY